MAKSATKSDARLGRVYAEATLRHEKETKATNRFNEDIEPTSPVAPKGVIGSLYLKKPYMEKASVITATIEDGEKGDKNDVSQKGKMIVCFTYDKETKNTWRFEEKGQVPGAERALVGVVYVNKAVMEQPPNDLRLVVVG